MKSFVYTSTSTTSLVFTRTYILEIFKEALEKAGFEEANLVFLLNEQPSNPYTYDKEEKAFIEVKEEVVNSWKNIYEHLKKLKDEKELKRCELLIVNDGCSSTNCK